MSITSGPRITEPTHRHTPATLEFKRSSGRMTIATASGMHERYRASFTGRGPKVRESDRQVTIEYPLISPREWLGLRRRATQLMLAAEISWSIGFGGGVAHLDLDLAAGALDLLEVKGGVSDVRLRLPVPRGVVALRVHGGVSRVTVERPLGIAVRLKVHGGASQLALDDERYGAIGGDLQLEAPGTGAAADRYEMEIGAGARQLTIQPAR